MVAGQSTFTETCSPSASASNATGGGPNTANAGYSVQAYTIGFSLNGTTPDRPGSSQQDILIGQCCSANAVTLSGYPASAPPVTVTTNTLTVPGTYVVNFTETQNGVQTTIPVWSTTPGWPANAPTNPSYWYWIKDGPQTVSCSATINTPNGPLSANLSDPVTVMAPTDKPTVDMGVVVIDSNWTCWAARRVSRIT